MSFIEERHFKHCEEFAKKKKKFDEIIKVRIKSEKIIKCQKFKKKVFFLSNNVVFKHCEEFVKKNILIKQLKF